MQYRNTPILCYKQTFLLDFPRVHMPFKPSDMNYKIYLAVHVPVHYKVLTARREQTVPNPDPLDNSYLTLTLTANTYQVIHPTSHSPQISFAKYDNLGHSHLLDCSPT